MNDVCKNLFMFIVCVHACAGACAGECSYLRWPETLDPSGAGVQVTVSHPTWVNLSPLQERPLLLTAESLLQSLKMNLSFLFKIYFLCV